MPSKVAQPKISPSLVSKWPWATRASDPGPTGDKNYLTSCSKRCQEPGKPEEVPMRDYARTGGSPPEPHPQEQARAQRSITFPARMTAGGRSPPAYYTATFFPPSPGRHLGAPPSRGGGVCDRPSYEAPSPPGTTDPAPPRPRGSDARPSHPERRRAGGASTDPIGVWVFRYYTDSEDLLARFPSTFLALSPPPGGTELDRKSVV